MAGSPRGLIQPTSKRPEPCSESWGEEAGGALPPPACPRALPASDFLPGSSLTAHPRGEPSVFCCLVTVRCDVFDFFHCRDQEPSLFSVKLSFNYEELA